MLPCQHSICDNCVVTYGLPSQVAEYYFDLTRCPICNQAFKITIRQLPPTKRPVVLSLDGGGIRGIIQLGLLHSLENRLGGDIQLSEIFELFVGTSVGMLTGPLINSIISILIFASRGPRCDELHGLCFQRIHVCR
jgi:hypothetical protein